jgi:hypothetical protein
MLLQKHPYHRHARPGIRRAAGVKAAAGLAGSGSQAARYRIRRARVEDAPAVSQIMAEVRAAAAVSETVVVGQPAGVCETAVQCAVWPAFLQQ